MPDLLSCACVATQASPPVCLISLHCFDIVNIRIMAISDLGEKLTSGAARLFKREDADDGASDGLRGSSKGGIGFTKGGSTTAGSRPWSQLDAGSNAAETSTLQIAVRGIQVNRYWWQTIFDTKQHTHVARRSSACSWLHSSTHT